MSFIDSAALVSETLLGLSPIPTDTGSGRVHFREIIRAFTVVFVVGRTALAQPSVWSVLPQTGLTDFGCRRATVPTLDLGRVVPGQ